MPRLLNTSRDRDPPLPRAARPGAWPHSPRRENFFPSFSFPLFLTISLKLADQRLAQSKTELGKFLIQDWLLSLRSGWKEKIGWATHHPTCSFQLDVQREIWSLQKPFPSLPQFNSDLPVTEDRGPSEMGTHRSCLAPRWRSGAVPLHEGRVPKRKLLCLTGSLYRSYKKNLKNLHNAGQN